MNSKYIFPSTIVKYYKISGNAISLLEILHKNIRSKFLHKSSSTSFNSYSLFLIWNLFSYKFLIFIKHKGAYGFSSGRFFLTWISILFITQTTYYDNSKFISGSKNASSLYISFNFYYNDLNFLSFTTYYN